MGIGIVELVVVIVLGALLVMLLIAGLSSFKRKK